MNKPKLDPHTVLYINAKLLDRVTELSEEFQELSHNGDHAEAQLNAALRIELADIIKENLEEVTNDL